MCPIKLLLSTFLGIKQKLLNQGWHQKTQHKKHKNLDMKKSKITSYCILNMIDFGEKSIFFTPYWVGVLGGRG